MSYNINNDPDMQPGPQRGSFNQRSNWRPAKQGWVNRGRGGGGGARGGAQFASPYEQEARGPQDNQRNNNYNHRGQRGGRWNNRGEFRGRNFSRGGGYRGRGGNSGYGGRGGFKNQSYPEHTEEQFNPKHYVIPAMMGNPWAKLEQHHEKEKQSQ